MAVPGNPDQKMDLDSSFGYRCRGLWSLLRCQSVCFRQDLRFCNNFLRYSARRNWYCQTHRFAHYSVPAKTGTGLGQHSLSKKVKKSKRYEKKRLRVANIYEKISNSRSDLIHKTTSMIIKNYDVIYLEDLNIKGLSHRCKPKKDENGKYLPNGQSAKSGLNKSILDVAWGQFIDTLEYKAEWNDKQVIHIDRFFPSSKTCSKCGWIKNDLKLKDRVWVCPVCGEKHDRDLNAAKNILNEGLRLNISDGTSDYGCGDQIRLDLSSIICEASKEMDQLDPETTTSLV